MNGLRRYDLVLALYPNARGFAFVLFEGSLAVVDWGVVEVRDQAKNRTCIQKVSQLFGRYRPDALVVQNASGRSARRATRIQELHEDIALLAETQGISLFAYRRAQVRQTFEYLSLVTKQTIAEAIAKQIPMFERYLPPARKIWTSEDTRMGLFDAAALALTFYRTIAPPERNDAGKEDA